MDQNIEVFTAIPAFYISGDAIDDMVVDGFAEAMEIKPKFVKAIEYKDDFLIFSNEINISLEAANKQIETSKNIKQNYDKSVHYITKLIRRFDTTQTKYLEVSQEVSALKSRNEELQKELENIQNENAKKAEAAKKIEEKIRTLVNDMQK